MPKKPPSPDEQQPGNTGAQDVPLDQQNIPAELPADARERLAESRGEGGRRKLFTSDLSVSELALIHDAGFEPVGMVVGSSVYHIGWQPNYSASGGFGMGYVYQDQELDTLTAAKYQARELAMSRMEAEADALGADGIVGVRLDVGRYEWGADLAEFIAIGTAVRSRDGTNHRTKFGKPFTSDLSGQDFRTLLAAGYRPQGMVMGSCVYHVAYQGLGQWMRTVGRNTEMTNYTQGLYDARELAMERMQAEAENLGADGITGTQIKESSHGWDSHVIEFFAVGTAVIAISQDHQITPPQLVLSLNS
jgi:uncharacterized protein YbjQ (UPF0145 family)